MIVFKILKGGKPMARREAMFLLPFFLRQELLSFEGTSWS